MKNLKFFFAFLLVLGSVAFWAEPGLALLQKGGVWNLVILANAVAVSLAAAYASKGDAKASFSWIFKTDDQGNVVTNRFVAVLVLMLVATIAGAITFIKEA